MKWVLHTITFNRDIRIIYYHTALSTMSNYLDLSTSVRMPEPNYIPTFAGFLAIWQSPWSQKEKEPRHIHAIYEQFNSIVQMSTMRAYIYFISFQFISIHSMLLHISRTVAISIWVYVDILLYENLSLKRPIQNESHSRWCWVT